VKLIVVCSSIPTCHGRGFMKRDVDQIKNMAGVMYYIVVFYSLT